MISTGEDSLGPHLENDGGPFLMIRWLIDGLGQRNEMKRYLL